MGDSGENLYIIESLKEDLASDNNLKIKFQPVFDVEVQRVWVAEALLRWRHPQTAKYVPPKVFVELAEKFNFSVELDRWVFKHALDTSERWWREFPDAAPRISINVTAASIEDRAFQREVIERAQRLPSAIRPMLEITERVLARPAMLQPAVRQLRQAGLSLSVDDFGSGYSSLAHFAQTDVDALKVDRDLLNLAGVSRKARTIFRSLLRVGKDLGVRVVIEGVEDASQLGWLRSIGGRFFQGFYFSPPLSESEYRARFLLRNPTFDLSDADWRSVYMTQCDKSLPDK